MSSDDTRPTDTGGEDTYQTEPDDESEDAYPTDGEPPKHPRRWLLFGVAFAGLWLFVRGVELFDHGTLELGHVLGEFLIGLTVGVPIAYGFRRFYSPTPVFVRTPRAVVAAAKYTAVFLWELVTANVDVARRVLSPAMPIDPAVIEVPLRVETDIAVTSIANSITLTPGTLTMDYDAERNVLYVHTLAATDRESVVEPIRAWEDYALVMFDERRDPGSDAPELDELSSDPQAAAGDGETAGASTGDDATGGSTRDGGGDDE